MAAVFSSLQNQPKPRQHFSYPSKAVVPKASRSDYLVWVLSINIGAGNLGPLDCKGLFALGV